MSARFPTRTAETEIPVIGQEHAPNLSRFLASQNLQTVAGPQSIDAAMTMVASGSADVILVIPEDYPESLKLGTPAKVQVIIDQANASAERAVREVTTALYAYGRELTALRLLARGVNPMSLQAINVDRVDVSTPSGRSALLLGTISYFLIFAMLLGGMYLAIDSTAGERERGSLEPLFSLPVTRNQLMLGKIAATGVFMALPLLITLLTFFFALKFLPLSKLGMTPNYSLLVVLAAFFILIPFSLVGASLMTLVASFTKSYKEAQTWLGLVLIAPTMPILIASILAVRPQTGLMFIPSLSQHLIFVDLIKNEPINALHVLISVSTTLALGALLTWVCARLYRREGLLG